jgi:hypothetical protein
MDDKNRREVKRKKMDSKAIRTALVAVMVFSVFVAATLPASASATADNFGVEDAREYKNTNVLVPVNITNVHSDSIVGVEFEFLYDSSVINLAEVQKGALTSQWTDPHKYGTEGDYVIAIVGAISKAITNGSTGSVVVLNFSVIGDPGETSRMDLATIKLVNTTFKSGTAPAKNGTFTVEGAGSISGSVIYACNGTKIAGATVNLMKDSVIASTTTTDSTGNYTFTDVPFGTYLVNVSKNRFWDNSTSGVTLSSPTTTVDDIILWLKGDLNNDGTSAGIGDVTKMWNAWKGEIPKDYRYDLNLDGTSAGIGDVTKMWNAWKEEITLE